MALVTFTEGKMTFASGELGTDTYILGDTGNINVGTMAIQVVTRSAGTISIAVQGRSRLGAGTDAQPPLVAIPFLPLHLNGAVGTYGTGSTAALTGNSLILVPASGLDIALDVTYTSGTHDIYISRLQGAAA